MNSHKNASGRLLGSAAQVHAERQAAQEDRQHTCGSLQRPPRRRRHIGNPVHWSQSRSGWSLHRPEPHGGRPLPLLPLVMQTSPDNSAFIIEPETKAKSAHRKFSPGARAFLPFCLTNQCSTTNTVPSLPPIRSVPFSHAPFQTSFTTPETSSGHTASSGS